MIDKNASGADENFLQAETELQHDYQHKVAFLEPQLSP